MVDPGATKTHPPGARPWQWWNTLDVIGRWSDISQYLERVGLLLMFIIDVIWDKELKKSASAIKLDGHDQVNLTYQNLEVNW